MIKLFWKIYRFNRKLMAKVRSILLVKWYGFKGGNIIIGKNVDILYPENVSIGNNTVIGNNCELLAFKSYKDVEPAILIGDGVLLNKYSVIGCANKVIIEDHVIIAPYVHITDRNHSYSDVTKPISFQPDVSKGEVRVGSRTWIGFGSQIMSGVTIGKHCVIAAGSVVTKSIDDYTVVAGNPAKPIRRYNQVTKKWEKI